MRAFGAHLGATLRPGDLVILDGPLGAGKTTLTQGIGEGMQVRGRVTSPTFTIAREHRPAVTGGCPLVHMDCYRLLDTGGDVLGALDAIDVDTDLTDCAVVAEWGEGLVEQLTDAYLLVQISRGSDDEVRTVSWRRVQGDAGMGH
ncbi:tRNA (adenosine(37)-N6)-threonylcarbamoyltransferase complex ATPase subunit type 1 TsaE [Corynebacterium sp. TAE3-ERU12]|uniref:tRNA (adenosine(37)-N6)-threonylcarbamoyltransferase complex ATPase subunit type 1 TsaE n=1 Tax=Corynebacterium sp. TAE3-ERU12 TaxID=2849491 RepID=UPI002106E26F|nr:tRNA (adenosine(37)-N6)-threonylcarbamoyltransferase complex ATPase subunit type 1 TsaE [Corynebacterium sp. TAE3-ERU12]